MPDVLTNNFNLTLDTTPPAAPSIQIAGGAAQTISLTPTLSISSSELDIKDMLIYGDIVDSNGDPITESDAVWQTFASTASIRFDEALETKTVYVKLRDDVGNISTAGSATIELVEEAPVVTIQSISTGTVTNDGTYRISEQTGYNQATVTFRVDKQVQEYKAVVVQNTTDLHTAGTAITGTSWIAADNTEIKAANTDITLTITGTNYKTAVSSDGTYIVKIFAKSKAGNWSV